MLDLAELRPPPPSAPGLDLDHEDVSFREADNQVDFDAVPVDDGPEEPEAFEPPPPIRPAPAAAPAPASEPLLSNVANATVAGAFQKLSTTVLTSTVCSFFHGQQPDLSWITEGMRTPGLPR